jgi:polyphosphate:AMP phosphotransferase
MFETVEIGSRLSKQAYREHLKPLRVDLLNAQFDLRHAGFSVLVTIVGDDRFGTNEVLNKLHEWMDARYIDTHVFAERTPEEREQPRFWRYWRALPARGRIGILYGGWALHALAQRARGELDEPTFAKTLARVRRLEEMLAEDGTLILKFWVHLSKKELKRRLKELQKNGTAPIEEADWEVCERFDELLPLAERLIRETDTELAPWHLVESTDDRHRDLTVADTIRTALLARLAEPVRHDEPRIHHASPAASPVRDRSVLDAVDLAAALDEEEYEERLASLQAELARLSVEARKAGRSSVLVFEGWDAAGKGGVIRRLTGPLRPRDYRVVPVAAPTEEELAHHYLWRFWRQLPRAGRMLIFDRSWYGRVLVERVEGLASGREWRRAYEEINDFEAQLVEHGTLVRKYFLHIDKDEQLARFKAREQTPYKKYKLTEEDYRNRDKWDLYVAAVDEMVARTSTDVVPWMLVPANDKRYARVRVLEDVKEGFERLLK